MLVLSIAQRAQLESWLSETGELYVDLFLPHSGGGGTPYFIRAIDEIEDLIASQKWRNLQICIFRRLHYPLRGIADDSMLEQALRDIRNGEWFHIVSLDNYYPLPCAFLGSGDSHAELRAEFADVKGQKVGIGINPFDYDENWIYSTPDEAMALRLRRVQDRYEYE